MLVEKYIKTMLVYRDYYSGKELINEVDKTVEKEIKVDLKTTLDTSKLSSMTRYFNFLNYAFLAGCVYCISMILSSLKNENIRTQIMSFRAPEHRLEKVREMDGITFYNDSKATNPEASIVAIDSFNNVDVALILGGRDKNTDLTEMCHSINKHIKTVLLIALSERSYRRHRKRFEENLVKNGFSNIIKEHTMEDAIDKAISLKPDVVLLSPACASFDMFNSYEHRGDVFKKYVLSK